MSAAFDQQFKIFLQVQADTAEISGKLNPAIDGTKAKLAGVGTQAAETGTALGALAAELAPLAALLVVSAVVGAIQHANDETIRLTKEIQNTNEELNKQVAEWSRLSSAAEKFGDVVKLGDKIAVDLAGAAAEMDKFRAVQLPLWKTWVDTIVGYMDQLMYGRAFPAKFATEAKAAADAAALDAQKDRNVQSNIALEAAKDSAANIARIMAEPLSAGAAELQSKLELLKQERDLLDTERVVPKGANAEQAAAADQALDSYTKTNDEIQQTEALLEKINKEQADADKAHLSALDKTALLNAQASNDPQLAIQQRVTQEYDRQLAIGKEKYHDDALAKADATAVSQALKAQLENQLAIKNAAGATAAAHQDILEFLSEESTLLQAIKQKQQLTQQDPFLFAGEKAAADLKLIPQQIDLINQKISEGTHRIAGGGLDPQTYERAIKGIHGLQFEAAQLGQKFHALTQPIRTELTAWVNSFGDTMHQVGNLITSTLSTAVSGLSTAITGLIFKTTTWGQAFAQVAQAIIGNIIQIVVQWAAQQLVMLALQAVFGQSSAAITATAASESAAAWAPAATAASIATEGEADIVGTAALAAAMLVGQGIVTGTGGGGAEQGGFTWGREGYPVNMQLHGQEFVWSAPAVRNFGGAERLAAAHAAFKRGDVSAPGFAGGGGSSGSGKTTRPTIHQHLIFLDPNLLAKHIVKTTAHKVSVVRVSNRHGGHLRS